MRKRRTATSERRRPLGAAGILAVALLLTSCTAARAQLIADLIDRSVTLQLDPAASKAGMPVYSTSRTGTPIRGFAVQGFAEGEQLDVEVRVLDEGSFGPWYAAKVVRSATGPAFLAGVRFEHDVDADELQIRFSVSHEAAPRILSAGVFEAVSDGIPDVDPDGRDERSPVELEQWLVVPPGLRTRAEWGAAPFRGDSGRLGFLPYRNITFHHAAGFGAETLDEGLEQVKLIQEFHQEVRGWSDIGYHFVMDARGRLYQGRPFLDDATPFAEGPPLVLGAHAGGANTSNVGVCVLGCYHPPEGLYCRDELTASSLDSLVASFSFLSERYGVLPDAIMGHRDFGPTACPGNTNYALLPEIRNRVESLLRTGNLALGRVILGADTDAVGVVKLSWEVIDDNGIAGFALERADPDSLVSLADRLPAPTREFLDTGLRHPGPVAYRLYVVDAEGRRFLAAGIEVEAGEPASFSMAEVFPNPFEEVATVRYYLKSSGIVRLSLHDAVGREIRSLADAYREGGIWYSARVGAEGLAAGAYFVRITVEGFAGTVFEDTRPVLLLR